MIRFLLGKTSPVECRRVWSSSDTIREIKYQFLHLKDAAAALEFDRPGFAEPKGHYANQPESQLVDERRGN